MAVLLRWMLAATCAVAAMNCRTAKAPEPAPGEATNPSISAQAVDPRPVIATFGDSISAGFGVEAGKSYPDDLQRLIDAAGYRYNVVNMGVSGDTTTDAVERLPSVLSLKPAIVILEFGGNDGLRGLPVKDAQANLGRVIESLQSAHSEIVLAGMTLPRNYGPEYIHAFEQMYVDLAQRYKLVRIPFLLDQVGGVERLTQPDGIHPTAEGAAIVATTAMQYLEPLLKKN